MPLITDIFNQKPFQAVELTNFMTTVNPRPTLLGTLGARLYRTINARATMIAAFKQDGLRRLVPVSPYGAPPVELEKAGGQMRPFFTRRMAKGSTVYAYELQGILQMPLFDAVRSTQAEVADRSGLIRDDLELTHEHQRLGMIQGRVIDADGTTVLDDWFDAWGVTPPAAFNFHLDVADTDLRLICHQVRSAMWNASGGSWVDGVTEVHALCGEEFFTSLISHPTIRETYLNYTAAATLRGEIPDVFPFGGIIFHLWRGNPDIPGSVNIPTDEARFFPIGATDVFQRVFGPAEFDPFVNQPGRELVTLTIPDRDRQAWVRVEMYSYPLYMCLRPEMLQTGVAAA